MSRPTPPNLAAPKTTPKPGEGQIRATGEAPGPNPARAPTYADLLAHMEANDVDLTNAARELGVKPSTARMWRTRHGRVQAKTLAPPPPAPRRATRTPRTARHDPSTPGAPPEALTTADGLPRPDRERAIDLLAAGWSNPAVAAELGITRQSLHVWVHDPAFVQALRRRLLAIRDAAYRKLQGYAARAVEVHLEIMDDEDAPAGVRLAAAQSVLDRIGISAKKVLEVGGSVELTVSFDPAKLAEMTEAELVEAMEQAQRAIGEDGAPGGAEVVDVEGREVERGEVESTGGSDDGEG